MAAIRHIIGGLLIILAVLAALRIPKNLHSDDPKAGNKVVADIILIAALGFGGVMLVRDRSDKKS